MAEQVDPESADPVDGEGEVGLPGPLVFFPAIAGKDRRDDGLGVLGGQGGEVGRSKPSVDAQVRGGAGFDVDVGRALVNRVPQERVQADGGARRVSAHLADVVVVSAHCDWVQEKILGGRNEGGVRYRNRSS